MKIDLKEILIGPMIEEKAKEMGIEPSRICNFLKCTEADINEMYKSKSLDSELLLRWSKLLEYDFFRIYAQHLILYSPQGNIMYNKTPHIKSKLPQFRKNIYTKEIIGFIMEQIQTGEKTKLQVIEEYRIPKTTLYKWIKKYGK